MSAKIAFTTTNYLCVVDISRWVYLYTREEETFDV
jgi:hypothetical protein